MALYRSYRPKIFGDVVGQDHVVHTLAQAVKQGKVSHAYLLSGPRGTGKTTLARILARAILTEGLEPAAKKSIEDALDDGSLIDLMEIDAASNRGIDDIRSLLEKLHFAPVVCKAKVHIIDEVHMLSKDAFNALLKTLEEPPPYAYFVLATTELHKVPATIQSRCQRFALHQIPEEEIIQRLQFVAGQEHIAIDRPALRAIAHQSDGIMRDALSLLDQLRSLPNITAEEVERRTGENGQELAQTLFDALENGDDAEILATVARVEERALPVDQVLRLLLRLLRNDLHAAITAGRPTAMPLRRLEAVLDAMASVRNAPVAGLVAEAALLSLLTPAQEPPSTQAAAPKPQPRMEAAAPHVPATAPIEQTVVPTPATETPERHQPVSATVIDAEDVTLQAIREKWENVLRATEPASVRMSLKDASLRSLNGKTLTLAFSSNFHRNKVAATEASRAVEAVLEEFFLSPLRIACELETQEKRAPAAKPELVNLAEAASEIF